MVLMDEMIKKTCSMCIKEINRHIDLTIKTIEAYVKSKATLKEQTPDFSQEELEILKKINQMTSLLILSNKKDEGE